METALLEEIRLLRRTVVVCSIGILLGMCATAVALFARMPSASADQLQMDTSQIDPMKDAKDHPYDREKALAAAQEYISRHPQGYYGYAYLGNIHLATGDLVKAETNYSRAYSIVPLPETRLRLVAIRKSLGMQPPKE